MTNYYTGSEMEDPIGDANLPRLLYTIAEVGQMIPLGDTSIRKAIKSGELGCTRIGWKIFLSREQIETFLKKKEVRRYKAKSLARQILDDK